MNHLFKEISRKLKENKYNFSLIDILNYIRNRYLNSSLSYYDKKILSKFSNFEINQNDSDYNLIDFLKSFEKHQILDWGDYKFHLNNRVHLNNKSRIDDFSLLFELIPELKNRDSFLKSIIMNGMNVSLNGSSEKRFFDLSIMPLNILLGNTVLNYFIPPNDYLLPHPTKRADPYGLIHSKTRAKIGFGEPTPIIDKETNLILGSHKFSNTFLFNIDFYCPMGCSDCYKTRMGTREYLGSNNKRNRSISKVYKHPELGQLNPPSREQVIFQAKKTVEWLNITKRGNQIRDIIISGGEPLWLPDDILKSVLNEFSKVKYLSILRICTGALFLGTPFRFDDNILNMLEDFSTETGIRVTLQAHLGNSKMISPETIIAIRKIRQRKINIYSQIPIKNNINFFTDEIEKTVNDFVELGKRQVLAGVEPYMFIVDMHPSTNEYYIPLELILMVWCKLVESHDFPGLERPRTLSILFNGGNIILSGHTLYAAKKSIDIDNDKVIYQIPLPAITSNHNTPSICEFFKYEEPLIKGLNDDPESLKNLRKIWFESIS